MNPRREHPQRNRAPARVWGVLVLVGVGALWLWSVPVAPPPSQRAAEPGPAPATRPTPPDLDPSPSSPSPSTAAPPTALPPPPPPSSGFCEGPDHAPGHAPPHAFAAVQAHLNAHDALTASQRATVDALAALSRGKPSATEMFDALNRDAERSGVPALDAWLGLMALNLGRPFAGARAMDRAVRALPEEHAFWKPLAELLAHSGQVARAATWMKRYAEREPGDWAAGRRARLMEVQAEVEAGFVTVADGRFPLRHDPAVPAERVQAVLAALHDAEPRAAAMLGNLPDPVSVVIYAERADLLASTCAQGWSSAVFDGRMRFQDEAGGALRNDGSLRAVAAHELVHAFQRRLGARRDGWLIEGLARYVAHEENAHYRQVRAMMASSGATIPMGSMMGTLQEFSDAQDSGLAYDQALMMVHWVAEKRGEPALRALVTAEGANTAPVGVELLANAMAVPAEQLDRAFAQWVREGTP